MKTNDLKILNIATKRNVPKEYIETLIKQQKHAFDTLNDMLTIK